MYGCIFLKRSFRRGLLLPLALHFGFRKQNVSSHDRVILAESKAGHSERERREVMSYLHELQLPGHVRGVLAGHVEEPCACRAQQFDQHRFKLGLRLNRENNEVYKNKKC